MAVAVDVGVGVVVEVGDAAGVSVFGGEPKRAIRGPTHTARSCSKGPLVVTLSMNLTLLPASELRSRSTG